MAAATRDPSVAAAAGSGGGDAESLHALISSALLLQDEALIAGSSQVGRGSRGGPRVVQGSVGMRTGARKYQPMLNQNPY